MMQVLNGTVRRISPEAPTVILLLDQDARPDEGATETLFVADGVPLLHVERVP